MFGYYKTQQWAKGRKLLDALTGMKINFSTLKGLFGNECHASRCQIVNTATEIFLKSGSVEKAMNILKDTEWMISSPMWPCESIDVVNRHNLLCKIAEQTSQKNMYVETLEVLTKLPGLHDVHCSFDVTRYDDIFNRHLWSCFKYQNLRVCCSIVEFMVSKNISVDFCLLRKLIHKLGQQCLWPKARSLYKCALSLGCYPPFQGNMYCRLLSVPCSLSEIEMTLALEVFIFSNAHDIKNPSTSALQIVLKSSWLSSNEASATKKQKDSLPHRAELKRLKKMLCHKLRLADIRWQRSWGIAHRCSQLHSLSRLHQQNPESLLNVEGHTIIFTDQSGMNAAGHVMLGTTDVHHQWAKLFERLPSYSSLLAQSELLKDRISQLLGGIQVIHIERLQPLLTIEEYFNTLSAFQKRLSSCWVPFHPRSLQGLQMTLENDRSSPRLHELGHFIIPSACEPTTLQWFIQTKAPEARRRMKRRDELEAEENDLVLYCLESLSLKRLYKEPSVSSKQMIPCCRRLMEERCPYVQGMRLCVSHFYSVLQDGDLCIPWDWKS
ncbi:TCAIM protein, partial [Amia calva]|nr:TCAIM protein [Amia calva]